MKNNSHEAISSEIRKRIKEIEIHTRRLLRGALVGDSRSAVKGTGFEFDQIREYQLGDDVRFIDWSASARMNNLLLKQYIEERSRTVILAVDISASSYFGSDSFLKHDTIAQIASVLALVTDSGKDRVGLILFSDAIELFMPPSRGRGHIQAIMEKLFSFKPRNTQTSIAAVFKKIATIKGKDIVTFIVSDFIDAAIDKKDLAALTKSREIIGIRCLDRAEQSLPAVGFVTIVDRETGHETTIDLRRSSHQAINQFLQERITDQNKLLKSSGMQIVDIANNETFIGDLIRFFRRRMQY